MYQRKDQVLFDMIKWLQHHVDTKASSLSNTDAKMEPAAFKQLRMNPIKKTGIVHVRINWTVCYRADGEKNDQSQQHVAMQSQVYYFATHFRPSESISDLLAILK